MANKQIITEREKAVLRLQIYSGGAYRNAILYRLAYPGSMEAVDQISDIDSTASRWWNSRKIQSFYQEAKAVIDAEREAERKRIESEVLTRLQSQEEGSQDLGGVDYSDPRNQLRKLNAIVANSTNTDTQLDALKVLISKQTELAPEKRTAENKVQRFYTPLTCHSCPLYKEAKERLNVKSKQ